MTADEDFQFVPGKFWITFGFGHHMGPKKIPLRACYTIVEAKDSYHAHELIWEKREAKWSHCYESAEACGVDRHKLAFVEYCQLQPQQGDNL